MTKKYALDEVMTITEAAEHFDINLETLKSKLKPSVVGKEKIDHWIRNGLIRQSGATWLLTEQFIESNFILKKSLPQ